MSKHKPVLSIIVPVCNQADVTIKCFQSIRANTKTPYELIWIDNGSAVEEYSQVRYWATRPRMHTKLIKNKNNLGHTKATNQGIAEAKGKFCILLNNDTQVTQEWDKQLLRPFSKSDKVGATGPLTDSLIGWQGWNNIERRWKLGIPAYQQDPQKYAQLLSKKFGAKYVEVGGRKLPLSFFCCCIPRKIFKEIGDLDEQFTIGLGNDDDFAMRLGIYGYKQMLALGSFVQHIHRRTFKALFSGGIDSMRRHSIQILRKNAKKYDKLKKQLSSIE